MSRVFVTAAIVIMVIVLLLTGYDIINYKMGLPSVLPFLWSLGPDITSGFGMFASEYMGWLIGIIAGLVVALLLIRHPKFGRF